MYMKLSKTLSPFPCAVYRASFPKTFKEMSKSDGHYKKVIPGVIIGMAIGIWVANFLRNTSKWLTSSETQASVLLFWSIPRKYTTGSFSVEPKFQNCMYCDMIVVANFFRSTNM